MGSRTSTFDMLALQEGGIDAIMFSNERSLPYLTKSNQSPLLVWHE